MAQTGDLGSDVGLVLQALADDPRLGSLDAYEPSVTFMRALGQARDELAHSRIVAFMLDSGRSMIAPVVIRSILEYSADYLSELDEKLAPEVQKLILASNLSSRAFREKWFIDVIVEVWDGKQSIVLGIENKIDALERPRQVADYQEVLRQQYLNVPCVMLFLTPDGREPDTADEDSNVPCIPIGYSDMAGMLLDALSHSRYAEGLYEVTSNIVRHWKEDIVGAEHLRDAVLELWREHPKAMRLAMQYRPKLDDVKEQIVESITEAVGRPLHVTFHPRRGSLKEIKVTPESWWRDGMPLTVMLSLDPSGPPRLRLLVKKTVFKDHAERLQGWARDVNEADQGMKVDERFPLEGWWHEVIKADLERDGGALGDVWDQETASRAIEIAASWITGLEPSVRMYLETNAGPGTLERGELP